MARLVILAFVLFVVGCESTRYGVDQETWDGLTDEQRSATIAGYNERKQLEAERRLIGEQRRLIEANMAQEQMAEQIEDAVMYAPRIKVSVWAGILRDEDKVYAIERTNLVLRHEQEAELKVEDDEGVRSSVALAYRRGHFILGQGDGAIEVPYEDGWRKGKLYLERLPSKAEFSGTVHMDIRALSPEDEDGDDDLLKAIILELLD